MEYIDEGKHWSMSLGTLQRIDTQLRRINTIKMDYNEVNLELYAIALGVLYDEISPFLAKKEEKEIAQRLQIQLGEAYHKYNRSAIRRTGGTELFTACNSFNLFLREMLYEYDLLMHKGEDTRDKV